MARVMGRSPWHGHVVDSQQLDPILEPVVPQVVFHPLCKAENVPKNKRWNNADSVSFCCVDGAARNSGRLAVAASAVIAAATPASACS